MNPTNARAAVDAVFCWTIVLGVCMALAWVWHATGFAYKSLPQTESDDHLW